MTARDRRARLAASGAFAVQGLCFAAVLSQVPTLRDRFALDELQLTVVLAAVPVIAGVGSVLAGMLSPRTGSAGVLRVAGFGVCAAMAGIGLAPTLALLYVAVGLFGLAVGAVDATMNMQGVAIQRRYGRSILASCHGWWSVAGIASALAAVSTGDLDPELWIFLGSIASVGAVIALAIGPWLLSRSEEASRPVDDGERQTATKAGPAPWRIVLLVGLAVMVMFVGDSATTTWSTIYLRDVLDATGRIVPLGLAAYLACQLLGRTVADRIIGRFGSVATVVAGGLVAAAGFSLVTLAPKPAVAIAGFALVGVGLSVIVPLSFSAADALDPTGSGVVVARVNLFNYAGVVVGAALIGVIGEASDLRLAFAVPAVLVLGTVALAPAFRVADAARAGVRGVASRRAGARRDGDGPTGSAREDSPPEDSPPEDSERDSSARSIAAR